MSEREDAASPAPPQWLEDLGEAASALRELAQAEWGLLRAELRMARSAALVLLVVMVFAAACGMGLGLTLLALIAVALDIWFGWWVWSLVGLAVIMIMGLTFAFVIARRSLHWLTLPGTRAQWRSMAHRPAATVAVTRNPVSDKESSADEKENTRPAAKAHPAG